MKIVVLAGGLSSERTVSISSGFKVYNALKDRGHKVVLIDVFMGYEQELTDPETLFDSCYSFVNESTVSEQVPDIKAVKAMRKNKSTSYLGDNVEKICRCAEIAFIALHGGEGENGQLQAALDILGIRYTGAGYLGSAVAMNKGLTKSVLMQNRINTPAGELFTAADLDSGSINSWNYFPCVVKPCSGGSSVGVSKVENREEFLTAVKEALLWEDEVLVEEFVSGREFSVGLIEGKALPVIEIIPKGGFYDYVHKYQAGKSLEVCPAELDADITAKLQAEAEKTFKALSLEAYARIDFLLDSENNTYCLEANSLPGMTPTSLLPQEAGVLGISYGELCEKIIEVSLKKYN